MAARKKRTKRHVFCDSARSPHRTAKPSRVPSPSAPEGATGGDPFRSAIAERHVRLSIRVPGVSESWGVLTRKRRRCRATGRGAKQHGIDQARRPPPLARRMVIRHSPATGSNNAAPGRWCAVRSLSGWFKEEQHRKARGRGFSRQTTWHRSARRNQGGSRHRSQRGASSGPLAVRRSRERAPARPPTMARSPKHGELHRCFCSEPPTWTV